jgi:membrane-associated protease RseP (regulator of RpoE activity)
MMFNPLYRQSGMLALPYFLLFEMIGPLFEIQAYAALILSFFVGILNPIILAVLFVGGILFGMLVSLASLEAMARNGRYFTARETGVLIGYAILENFGPRQFLSVWRFTAFLSMFSRSRGWQKGERKGFERRPT